MILYGGNERDLVPRDISQANDSDFTGNLLETLRLLRNWQEGLPLVFNTSGSTGSSQQIELPRNLILFSIRSTAKSLQTGREHALLCIPAARIGGAMLVLRAEVLDWDLTVQEPAMDPMAGLDPAHGFSIISLVPAQLKTILLHRESLDKLLRFKRVLVGGEPLDEDVEQGVLRVAGEKGPEFYHTYGMTETAGHIALRAFGQEYFTAFDGVVLSLEGEDDLNIEIPELGIRVRSGDRATLTGDNQFQILGRNRFVVNSAGLKIPLEMAEQRMKTLLKPGKTDFFVLWKEADEVLGERLIMLSNMDPGPVAELLAANFEPYWLPRRYYSVPDIVYTPSGKIDRSAMYQAYVSRNQK